MNCIRALWKKLLSSVLQPLLLLRTVLSLEKNFIPYEHFLIKEVEKYIHLIMCYATFT